MSGSFRSRYALLYLIVGLAVIRGVVYAAIVPPWQAPDEPSHFERTKAALSAAEWAGVEPDWYNQLRDSLLAFQFLSYTLGRVDPSTTLPLRAYTDLYQEIYSGQYGSRFSYGLMGWPLFLAPDQNVTLQLYLVRLNTVLMGVAIIFLAFKLTETIFPDEPFMFLGVPLLILFNPQHTHMLSAVNNGNLAELLATLALFTAVYGLSHGFSWVKVLLLLGFSLAAMWTKPTAYFLFITLAGLGGIFLAQHRQKWPWFLLTGIILAGLTYFLLPARLSGLVQAAWAQLSQGAFYWEERVVPDIFMSFWAMPGWAILRLDALWYQILLLFCLAAGMGLIIWLVAPSRRLKVGPAQWQALLLLAISIVTAVTIQIGWHVLTGTLFYRQGRSLYPVIVPITIFLMLGWRQLVPPAWQKEALLGLAMLIFLFDSLVLFAYIMPFFYSRYG